LSLEVDYLIPKILYQLFLRAVPRMLSAALSANRQVSRRTSGLFAFNPAAALLKRPPRNLSTISRMNNVPGIRLQNIAHPPIPSLFIPDHSLNDILARPKPRRALSVPLPRTDDVEIRVLSAVEAVFLQAASEPASALRGILVGDVEDVEDLHASENEVVVGAVTVLRHDARVVIAVLVAGAQRREIQSGSAKSEGELAEEDGGKCRHLGDT
jgi:hypothetical protein